METDKKLQTMEEELKLLKGELKQSLASVRDYLLNLELPASDFANVLEALGDDRQKIIMEGNLNSAPPQEKKTEEPILEETEEEESEPEEELPLEDELINEDENLEPGDELLTKAEPEATDELGETEEAGELEEPDESLMSDSELPVEEEAPMMQGTMDKEASASTPRVNLLANLVHWVARAKREIGSEQLPAFLEVYGISGHLSPDLKELILHMADIALEQPEDGSSAEIWSQAMLSLHGILTGAGAPMYMMKPFWNDDSRKIKPDEGKPAEEPAEKKQKDTPVRLKLVLPGGNGKGKEFCLDLRPTVDNNED